MAVNALGSWTKGTSHTAESGTNRVLYFVASSRDGFTRSLTSVTYGGRDMTKVDAQNHTGGGGQQRVEVWKLLEAEITQAVNSTFNPTWDTTPGSVIYHSRFYENVDQASSERNVDNNSGDNSSPVDTDAALGTQSGDIVVGAATIEQTESSASATWGNSFTERVDDAFGGATDRIGTVGEKTATGANETPSVTADGTFESGSIIGWVIQASGLTGATISEGAGSDDQNVVVDWTNGDTSADEHELHRGNSSGFTPGAGTLINDSLSATATGSSTDTTSPAGSTVYYKLVTKKTGESDAESNQLTVSTAPARPTSVSASAGSPAGSLAVSWTDQSNVEDQFNVYYKKSSDSTYNAVTVGANVTSVTISGLTEGQTYDVHVTAENSNGESGHEADVQGNAATSGSPSEEATPLTTPTLSLSSVVPHSTDDSLHTVTLTYSGADEDADRHVLHRGFEPNFKLTPNTVLTESAQAPTNSLEVTQGDGSVRWYALRSEAAGLEAKTSNYVRVETPDDWIRITPTQDSIWIQIDVSH